MTKKLLFSFSVVFSCALLWLLIYLPISTIANVSTLTISEKMFIIFAFIFVCTFTGAIMYFLNQELWKNEIKKTLSSFIIIIITLNIPAFIYLLRYGGRNFYVHQHYYIRTFDLVAMSLMLVLYLMLDYVGSLIPYLPFFISFSIQFIPLFFLAYLTDFVQTFIVCLLDGLFAWLMPNNADAGNVWAFLFDYFFPILVVSIAPFLKPTLQHEVNDGELETISQDKKNNQLKKQTQILQWLCFVSVPYILGYFSKVLAGVLFWFENAWDGYNKWTYSFIFNSLNFAFDWMLGMILVPMVCTTLKHIKTKYY